MEKGKTGQAGTKRDEDDLVAGSQNWRREMKESTKSQKLDLLNRKMLLAKIREYEALLRENRIPHNPWYRKTHWEPATVTSQEDIETTLRLADHEAW